MSTITHDFITIKDIKLHIAHAGPKDGQLILFLHGFPENWAEWTKQLLFFSKKGFFAISIDQRGYNLSDKPKYTHNYRIDRLALDVIQVANYYGRKKFILVGHDWGANVAWWTALRYPSSVLKLVIINVPHPLIMKKILYSYPKQIFRSWYIFFLQIPLISEFFVSFNKGIVLYYLVKSSAIKGSIPENLLSYYRNSWCRSNVLSMINWYRGMKLGGDSKLSSIKVIPKTLLLWGLKDRFIVSEAVKPSLKLCKEPKCLVFPLNTHWLVHEQSAKVSKYIFEFTKQ